MRGFRSAGGFSLVEIVMVILIISLTLAVSYPLLSRGSASLHLRASGRDVLNLMRYAREKAITEQTGMMVLVDRGAGKLVLSSDLGQGVHSLVLPKDVKIDRLVFSGQEVLQGPLMIHFLSNGSSDSAELLLVADNGALLKVFTDPITGGARIKLGSGETSP
jgi:prepilin-type N-terminal cleavage/methylation domain-containing protein